MLDEYTAMRNFHTQMNLMRKHEAKYKPQYMLDPPSEPDSELEDESSEAKRPRMHSPVPASEATESDSD